MFSVMNIEESSKIYNYISKGILDIEKIMGNYNNYIKKIIQTNKINISKEDEEEILLDVYLTLWKNQKKLDINKKITPYIAGITKNLIFKKLRNKKITYNIEDYQDKIISLSNIDIICFQNDTNKKIIDYIENMKEEDKNIFINYYYQGMKIKEISLLLNISESKVKSKLYRIRKKLQKKFKKEEESYE